MDIGTRKYALIEQIMNLDEIKLKKLESMMPSIVEEKEDLLEYNEELNRSEKEIEEGNYYSQIDAEKIISGWR